MRGAGTCARTTLLTGQESRNRSATMLCGHIILLCVVLICVRALAFTVYVFVRVCVCVRVFEREREREIERECVCVYVCACVYVCECVHMCVCGKVGFQWLLMIQTLALKENIVGVCLCVRVFVRLYDVITGSARAAAPVESAGATERDTVELTAFLIQIRLHEIL
jgi:hypothetical protein